MTFDDTIRYNRLIQQVIHKRGESATNYINIFQNDKALEIPVGNTYSDVQLIYKLLEILQKGWRYWSQIAIHKKELSREEKLLIKNHYIYLTYKLNNIRK